MLPHPEITRKPRRAQADLRTARIQANRRHAEIIKTLRNAKSIGKVMFFWLENGLKTGDTRKPQQIRIFDAQRKSIQVAPFVKKVTLLTFLYAANVR